MIDRGEAESEGMMVTLMSLIPVPRTPWRWGPGLQQQEVEPAAAAAAMRMMTEVDLLPDSTGILESLMMSFTF